MCILTYSTELGSVGTDHAQLTNFPSATKIEQSQTHNTNLLIGARSSSTHETRRVLASADLSFHVNLRVHIMVIGSFTIIQFYLPSTH